MLQQRPATGQLRRVRKLDQDKSGAPFAEVADESVDQCASDAMALGLGDDCHSMHFGCAFGARHQAEYDDTDHPTIDLGDKTG